jgi:hypothetical protein
MQRGLKAGSSREIYAALKPRFDGHYSMAACLRVNSV